MGRLGLSFFEDADGDGLAKDLEKELADDQEMSNGADVDESTPKREPGDDGLPRPPTAPDVKMADLKINASTPGSPAFKTIKMEVDAPSPSAIEPKKESGSNSPPADAHHSARSYPTAS